MLQEQRIPEARACCRMESPPSEAVPGIHSNQAEGGRYGSSISSESDYDNRALHLSFAETAAMS